MSSDKLSRLLGALKEAGVEHGERNKKVAERTGYALGTITRILSGNANLTDRFIKVVCTGFAINAEWVNGGVEPKLREMLSPNIRKFVSRINRDELGLFEDMGMDELLESLTNSKTIAEGANKSVLIQDMVREHYGDETSKILAPFSKLEIIEKRSILREIAQLLQSTGRGVYEDKSPGEVAQIYEAFEAKKIKFTPVD